MKNVERYQRVPVVHYPEREWPGKEIQKAPAWCSVDLRDGNQALVEPMVVEEKIEMFNLLVEMGFKEIEIGFPAASQIEFDFLRQLVDRNLIPDDVMVQVLTQCREHLVKRTFEAIQGIKKAVVHIYNSTSTLQRDVVFHMDREEIKKIAALPNVEIEGMFTHFARADETDKAPAVEQLKRYLTFADLLEKAGVQIPLKHCSNSAGIIRMPEANLNLVRAGITIYGIYPSDEVERDIVKLKPAMELKSHVAYVKDLPAGTAISYGGTFASENDLRVATIPVGYADGYPRTLSNKGWVLIHGQKAPILGRVCMDQFMVDVTHIPDVKHGDEVTLIGRDGDEFISIETFGDMSGRFSYEFACDISKRVPRVYIKDGRE